MASVIRGVTSSTDMSRSSLKISLNWLSNGLPLSVAITLSSPKSKPAYYGFSGEILGDLFSYCKSNAMDRGLLCQLKRRDFWLKIQSLPSVIISEKCL
ncbi:hypothetical protein ACB092_12G078300 [Castanea dentata]